MLKGDLAEAQARSRRPDLQVALAIAILEHARAQGLGAGAHLPETALAAELRVSRTPIRAALRLLEQNRLVESRQNRGCFLVKAVRPGRISLPQGGDDEKVYLRIAEDRLAGRLPDRVKESELARRYDIARPNLLRLLGRMAREGWVERQAGHGWEFQPVLDSARSYAQSYRFRILIEPAALLEDGYRADPATFARIRAQQDALLRDLPKLPTAVEMFEASAAFHEAIVGGAGNPLLLEAIRRVNRFRRLMEYRTRLQPEQVAGQCRSNLRLLDLLEAGENRQAAEILRQHLEAALSQKAQRAG